MDGLGRMDGLVDGVDLRLDRLSINDRLELSESLGVKVKSGFAKLGQIGIRVTEPEPPPLCSAALG